MNLPQTGRRVLVTGASRGLGRAVSRAFAANGDRVAVHYGTREDDARHTLDSLDGTGHVLVGGDLSAPRARPGSPTRRWRHWTGSMCS